jgi:hypothetical protein
LLLFTVVYLALTAVVGGPPSGRVPHSQPIREQVEHLSLKPTPEHRAELTDAVSLGKVLGSDNHSQNGQISVDT